MSVITCVSGDRKLAATDGTDNLIQTLSLPRGTETKGYWFLHLGQEEESGERIGRWKERGMRGWEEGEARFKRWSFTWTAKALGVRNAHPLSKRKS